MQKQSPSEPQEDRRDLILWVQHGDNAAFRRLVERHAGMVTATLRRLQIGPPGDEDVEQVVFTILAEKANRLTRVDCLGAWLHRVTVNQAMRARRQLVRQRQRLDQAMELNQLEHEGRDPLTEVLPHLDEALDALPAKDRLVIFLRYHERKTFAQVALQLGRSEVALRKQVSRALTKLSHSLQSRGASVSGATLASALGGLLSNPGQAAASTIVEEVLSANASRPFLHGSPFTTLAIMSNKALILSSVAALLLCLLPIAWQESKILQARQNVTNQTASTVSIAGVLMIEPDSTTTPIRDLAGGAEANPPIEPEDPMVPVSRAIVDRMAKIESERTAAALEFSPAFKKRYHYLVKAQFTQRLRMTSTDGNPTSRPPSQDHKEREALIESVLGHDQVSAYRATLDQRQETTVEYAAETALHKIARLVPMDEAQTKELYQVFATAAQDKLDEPNQNTFSFGFSMAEFDQTHWEADLALVQSLLPKENSEQLTRLLLFERHSNERLQDAGLRMMSVMASGGVVGIDD